VVVNVGSAPIAGAVIIERHEALVSMGMVTLSLAKPEPVMTHQLPIIDPGHERTVEFDLSVEPRGLRFRTSSAALMIVDPQLHGMPSPGPTIIG
jgi:hypothetical protein